MRESLQGLLLNLGEDLPDLPALVLRQLRGSVEAFVPR